jgi:hypothetical protein
MGTNGKPMDNISPAATSIRTPVDYSLSLFPGLNKNEKLQIKNCSTTQYVMADSTY